MRSFEHSARMARQLQAVPLSELTPSRRDFSQYVATQRRGVAVIGKLPDGDAPAVSSLAREWDDAEVAALALEDLGSSKQLATVVTAPLFWDFPLLDRSQLYHARFHHMDAVLLPAAALGREGLEELIAVASSMHMAVVAEVERAADLSLVPAQPQVVLGVRSEACLVALAPHVPRSQGLVLLTPPVSLARCAELQGLVDAVMLGDVLQTAGDTVALVRRLGELG